MLLLGSLVLAALAVVTQVKAQIARTDARCYSNFDWAENSLGQNPCLVAAYLQQVCTPDRGFLVPALPQDYYYSGPSLALANACTCSSPVYSLLAACGACQSQTWVTWNEWRTNCSSYASETPEGKYNRDIPEDTRVPAWAYIRPSSEGGTFVISRARNFDGRETGPPSEPSSTAEPTPTSDIFPTFSFSTPPSISFSFPTSLFDRPTTSATVGGGSGGGGGGDIGNGQKKVPTGPIGGAFVGLVVGIALLALGQ